ncbi:hemicentin-1-like [Limulus polyphemus]|uniref:Hemicentin-1-like n=1 Tax=Limulus polyphemus TaxID=6850 RepID=A0ABM1T5X3_LIMPO|nr:hemicentin-1-like [Limulus polyphemus]
MADLQIKQKYHIAVLLVVITSTFSGNPGIELKTAPAPDSSAPPPVIHVIVGGRAQLPCNITPPTIEDSVSLILWYRSDINAPLFTVDCRSGSLDKAKHFSSDFLGQRAHFDLRTRPALLTIEPVKAEDLGEYRCRVDYRWARTLNNNAILYVVVPPRDVVILDEKLQPLHRVIGPYNEDSEIRLKCLARGGRPSPFVSWWREMQLLDREHEKEDGDEVMNELVIRRLVRNDLNAELLCQVWNSNLTSSIVAAVFLDLNLKPLDVRILTTEAHYKAGWKYAFECRTRGSRPEPRISWWKDYILLGHHLTNVSHQPNISISTLVIAPSSDDHGRNLTCRVANPKLSFSSLEDSVTLNVYYKPQVRVSLQGGRTSQAVYENDDAFLKCSGKGNPSITAVFWYFQGQKLKNNPEDGIIISNQSLWLQNVRREQSGFYRCSAVNSEGQGESEDLKLNIKYKPICKHQHPKFYTAMIGETVRIQCDVEAEPDDVIFFWRFNNTKQVREILTRARFRLRSIVEFAPRDHSDFGTITCRGKNAVGIQKDACKYVLISVGPPEKVTNCTWLHDTSDFVHVECKPGHDGGLRQQFQLEVYNAEWKHLQINLTSHKKPVFQIPGVAPGASLVLVIYAINAKGRSPIVEMNIQTSLFAERHFEFFIINAQYCITNRKLLIFTLIQKGTIPQEKLDNIWDLKLFILLEKGTIPQEKLDNIWDLKLGL